jgi:hypothetical protein
VKRKFGGWIFFFFNSTHDPTPIQMANRDSDDDKKGRKRRFSISDDAFESDDDGEFMSDHEFEAIFNPSQKKKMASTKPKDFSKVQAENIFRPSVSLEPVPERIPDPKPIAPKLIPCLRCRQPFLRIKRPFLLTGPKLD